MKFFDREHEIAELRRIRDMAVESSRFTVLTGRRRVGKTELIADPDEARKQFYGAD